MAAAIPFEHHVQARADRLSPAELRVARYFASNREEVLVAPAAELAAKAGTSDATVIRAARALGYDGLEALRRSLAEELRYELSPARRVARTLQEVGDDPARAFEATLDLHISALTALRGSISAEQFRNAVDYVVRAPRVAVFGLGPSSAMATYLSIQIRRFGLAALTLTDTGLLLADGLLQLRDGDLLLVMAYGRVYPELKAMFDRARELGLRRILMTDTLGAALGRQTDLVLTIPRGRTDAFSMHTATLAFIEALLVGIATRRPAETLASLDALNRLRTGLAGGTMRLGA